MSSNKIQISALKEEGVHEKRVALVPETVKKLLKKNFEIAIESSAGDKAGFLNSDYESEGAKIVSRSEALRSPLILKVTCPSLADIAAMNEGALMIASLDPFSNGDAFKKMAERKIGALALELIPRISRAQAMDILSSQANIAGYRAVMEAASLYQRFVPMMMTSAGAAKPAKALVLGAGVAGLQAIATLRRMGAQVEAFDIRPEVKEQIESLGAKFLNIISTGAEGAGAGGYAKELSEEARKAQQAALQEAIARFDIVISTASIPGRKAPTLITRSAVHRMRRGSVILDMAAATGGNCEATLPGEIHHEKGVIVSGPLHLASQVATDASRFFSTNLYHLLSLFSTDEGYKIPLDDEIIAASLVTHEGQILFPKSPRSPQSAGGQS